MIHDDTDDEYIWLVMLTMILVSLLITYHYCYYWFFIIIVINYGDNKDYDGGDGDDYYSLVYRSNQSILMDAVGGEMDRPADKQFDKQTDKQTRYLQDREW